MKRTIIISSAIILALTGGIIFMNQPTKDDTVKTQALNVGVQEPVVAPVSPPEPVQEVLTPEVSNEPISEPERTASHETELSRDVLINYASSIGDADVPSGDLVVIALSGEKYFNTNNYKRLMDGIKEYMKQNWAISTHQKLAELERLSKL